MFGFTCQVCGAQGKYFNVVANGKGTISYYCSKTCQEVEKEFKDGKVVSTIEELEGILEMSNMQLFIALDNESKLIEQIQVLQSKLDSAHLKVLNEKERNEKLKIMQILLKKSKESALNQ